MGSQMGNSDPVCGPRQHLQWLARRQRSRRLTAAYVLIVEVIIHREIPSSN